jgi:ABC-type amino acid transport system permease subunit
VKKLILLLPLILTSCSSNHEWAWYIISPDKVNGLTNLKFLLSGMSVTIYISVISIIISMVLGFIVAIPSLGKSKFLTYINMLELYHY